MRSLHAGSGRFRYQVRRYGTKPITLMRWCQAWMAYALAVYLVGRGTDPPGAPPTVAVGRDLADAHLRGGRR